MKQKKIKSWQRKPIVLYIISGLVLLFLVLPILIVIPMSFTSGTMLSFPPQGFSFRWYEEFFESTKWVRAALTSVKIALTTMVCSLTLGTLSALGVYKKVMVKTKWPKLMMQIPMMIPAVIVAVSMYKVFGVAGIVGKFWTVVVAHTCLAIPMVVTLMSAGLAGLDVSQYDAARVLGATNFQAVMRVVLPLVKPSLLSSCLFGFITSFDESVLVLFITTNSTMTLPRLMFADLKYGISPSLAAISTMLICITLFFFLLSRLIASLSPAQKALRKQKKIELEMTRREEEKRKAEALAEKA